MKQGIGDPDGLPCAEHAPAQFKSPSTGSSLPQHLFNESWARKTGPETFEQALSITGPCYSVITGRSFCSGTQDSSQQLNTGGGDDLHVSGLLFLSVRHFQMCLSCPLFISSLCANVLPFTKLTFLSLCFPLSIRVCIYDLRSVYLAQVLGSGGPEAEATPQWVSLFAVCIH